MAEEKEESTEAAAKPKKKISVLHLALIGQLLTIIAAIGLLVKAVYFTPQPDLSDDHLRERAIASVRDEQDQIQALSLPEFTANLPKDKVIKTTVQLEVSDQNTVQAIQKRLPAIRSKVLSILSGASLSQINDLQGKLLIKDAIRDTINDELDKHGEKKGVVREVYFLEFNVI